MIRKEDINKIKRQLCIDKNIIPSTVFQNIMKMNVDGMSNEMFFKYLYVTDSYIENKTYEFLRSIDESKCIFHLIDGFSKNGKTNFVQYARYINNQNIGIVKEKKYRFIIISFDFEKGGIDSYKDKVCRLFIDRFIFEDIDSYKDTIKNLELFLHFYNNINIKINEEMDNINNETATYFKEFCIKLFGYIDNLIIDEGYGNKGDYKNTKKKFSKLIKSTIDDNNCGDYFSFIILYEIFTRRYRIFSDKLFPQKLIFILDNLDDYLNDKDILFFQQPQIQLSVFINHLTNNPIISTLFSECLKEEMETNKRVDWNFSFQDRLNIVYIFRTANFFVFSNIIQEGISKTSQSGERHYPRCLLEREFIDIKTIVNTKDIIKKRINFFEDIANEFNFEIPQGYYFIKLLAEDYYSDREEDPKKDSKNIFRIWNGEKKYFWDSIFENWDKIKTDFFQYEDILKRASENSFFADNFLIKGVYIYFFLKLFEYNGTLKKSVLKTIYSYKDSHHKGYKNIRRFLLNYIINKSEESGIPKTMIELSDKGVGLYDLLSEVTDFIKDIESYSDKNPIYNFNEIKDFFNDIYNNKIDFFGHLLTIYKSQIIEINGINVSTIYYDLTNEIYEFEKNKNAKELNKVRIYNNDSATYLSLYLLSYFELYSFTLSNNKPLLFTINKKNHKIKATKPMDFEFYDIIEKVMKEIKISVNKMVDFYLSHLVNKYPVHDFITNPFFSVLIDGIGSCQFRLHISRHITYIESFRRGIVEDILVNLENDEKAIANLYLTQKIKQYIVLYQKNYNKIKNSEDVNLNNFLNKDCNHALHKTYEISEEYKKIVKKIIKSKGFDFDSKIIV